MLNNFSKVINQVISLDSDAKNQLKSLSGKILSIEVTDLKLQFFVFPTEDLLVLSDKYNGEVHVNVQGTSVALLNMGLRTKAADSLFSGAVKMSGDVQVGQQFREWIAAIDIDWEEQLSHLTGDVIAHRVGNFIRGAFAWSKQTVDTLGRDAAEYFQHESQTLLTRTEVDHFLQAVDTVRDDVDRIEAKINRLQAKLKCQDER